MVFPHTFDSCHNGVNDLKRPWHLHNLIMLKLEQNSPDIDVLTCWNSTFHMFKRAIFLQKTSTNLMKLLEPLCEAIKILCRSDYPTLNKALPIYMVLMKHLKHVQQGLYDHSLLIQPASLIMDKINNYLTNALKKLLIMNASSFNHTTLRLKTFLTSFIHFFYSKLYQDGPLETFESELLRYLKEDVEAEGTNILQYWSNHQKTFPALSQMACCYLSIPATSAASERAFSNSCRILSWQRSSLAPQCVEQLLCLKEWQNTLSI
ncbi:uncharacterized protein VP01_7g26 [Puccinia sorghi]|uniref:HAT C-terminal dimerisation domain-containing protein n=1 Tax=Puccinia sorghi TaxID=27349 RepID=A0A0L6UAN8_9BASI|nr:uncharacterized protein VP01_7g26 [Puccinia sorghi]